MIRRLLAAELLKLRRTMVWVLVFLGPFGVVALTAVNFGLRYDYLVNLYRNDLWGGLLRNIAELTPLALLLGATLLASMLAGYEHRTNAWKQLLAMPVSRFAVFGAKFLTCALLLALSSVLLAVGTCLLGGFLGFGWSAPVAGILRISFYPMLASYAIAALQLWLSVVIKNQAFPMMAGIAGTIAGLFTFGLPRWVIWTLPIIGDHGAALYGMAASILLVLAGVVHFSRRDVA
ncbi:MAG: permease [Paenibacillaceae bacterium]|jgi:hypothetical protein|nr:permease [Paenibacillaceae bacterium]